MLAGRCAADVAHDLLGLIALQKKNRDG